MPSKVDIAFRPQDGGWTPLSPKLIIARRLILVLLAIGFTSGYLLAMMRGRRH